MIAPEDGIAGNLDWLNDAADRVHDHLDAGEPPSIKELLLPLFLHVGMSSCLRADSIGFWRRGEERYWLPRFTFQRTQAVKRRYRVGIFAGIHGDEPAGILGVMDFVRELDLDPEIGREYELSVYPLCNPTGYLARTRSSAAHHDLNREFWRGSLEPEVSLLEAEILRKQFDGIIALHSDDTCEGFYGFARGAVLSEQLLAPALTAAEWAIPRDGRRVIDGFHAVDGIIYSSYDGILSAPPTQRPQPFEIVLESPSHAPLGEQRRAFVHALRAILSEYRSFIAYSADL